MKHPIPNPQADMTAFLAPHDAHWAIEERSARQILSFLRTQTVAVHMEDVAASAQTEIRADNSERDYPIANSVAYLSLTGPMTKARTSYGSGTSTSYLRRQVRAVGRDEDVSAVILRIDSPGGSVSGTSDLANDVAALAAKKPVFAYIEDAGCSAAYWVASQCTKIYANPTALVGSIGTYMVLYDASKAYEKEGFEVLVFSTGPHKGAGTQGAAIDEAQRAEFQRIVDELNSHFLSAVASGRNLKVKAGKGVATGQVWLASSESDEDALSLGLIDNVGLLDDAVADLLTLVPAKTASRKSDLAIDENTISGEERSPAGLSLAEESESALAAVRGLTVRLTGLKEARTSEGRTLSEKAKGHAVSLSEGLAQAQNAVSDILAGDPDDDLDEDEEDDDDTPEDEPDAVLKKRLADTAIRGRLIQLTQGAKI